WRRSARGADPSWPCRHLDHPNLHACAGRAPEESGSRLAPAGGQIICLASPVPLMQLALQMRSYLDFEKPVAELEAKIEELRALQSGGDSIAIGEEINRIEGKAALALKDLYGGLTPWQKTQVARHPQRPHCLDYISALITDFVPLAGDRKHGEDAAIVGGFG